MLAPTALAGAAVIPTSVVTGEGIEELLEATTLCGPEGYVKERLAAYKESGVTVLNVTPVGPDPVKLIEQVKTWIEDL